MKRFERFLYNNDWLCWSLKALIVLYWIFGATGLYLVFVQQYKDEARYQRNRDPILELRHGRELAQFGEHLVEKAKSQGRNYSPKSYFTDLKALYIKRDSFKDNKPVISFTATNEMQLVLQHNISKGYFSEEDVDAARTVFAEWNKSDKGSRDLAIKELKVAGGWKAVQRWVINFYLQSMFLSLLLYLLRMVLCRGILETILADKRKFFFAVVGWMFFIGRYPTDTIREIIVEAELRRIGRLFRPLGYKEKALVRAVVTTDYQGWLTRFRLQFVGQFERSLLVAILATILVHIASPLFAAEKKEAKAPAATVTISQQSRAGPAITLNEMDLEKSESSQVWLNFQVKPRREPQLLLWDVFSPPSLIQQEIVRQLDHIPLGCLVAKRFVNQITGVAELLRSLRAKGVSNEKVCDRGFASCLVRCSVCR